MDDKTRLERIKNAIMEMREITEGGGIVIVEGKRDKASLSDLGIKNCVKLPLNKSILNFLEYIARQDKDVIIMTDWDSKGEELAKRIEDNLKSMDVLPDLNIRKRIRDLVCKDIKDVESLNRYLLKMVYQEFRITTEQFL